MEDTLYEKREQEMHGALLSIAASLASIAASLKQQLDLQQELNAATKEMITAQTVASNAIAAEAARY